MSSAARTWAARESELIVHATDLLRSMTAPYPSILRTRPAADEDIESALRHVIDVELEALRDPDAADDVTPADRVARLADVQDTYIALTELRARRRMETHDRAQECIERLRNVARPSDLLDRVASDLCASGGFERMVLSKVTAASWIVVDAHFEEDGGWADGLVRLGSETPPTLTPALLETQMVRRLSPAIVSDSPNDPYTHKPFVEYSESRCYVAAPIVPRGRVIGFLHADHHFSGRPVDATDRDTLWALAIGFAHAYERAVLLERLREQRDRIDEMVASTAMLVSDLCEADGDGDDQPDRLVRDRALMRGRTAALAARGADGALSLTPREVEVLSLIATGATNAVIASELFISEGTVKSHVNRILRKLDASNRAEAVSVFLRSKARDGAL